ncbi:CPBP family intramembrane glutamic endopeptidase [Leptospira sarikeiensis]|uniref:CPBP family intramembrane metalloprotease n=1 Tax=Leptospira sarikeiensis TaxID=2484943 RepID=A0A4R9K767_9LEPT|nr:type II CAAX endopeptidase family protein [Leptospira sarikeiensis]TGL60444.1 CPBP family intramembrane metalloprotease [Leptospira sarikeiensis]
MEEDQINSERSKALIFFEALALCTITVIAGGVIGVLFFAIQSIGKLKIDQKLIMAMGNSLSFGFAIWVGLKISKQKYKEVLRLNLPDWKESVSFIIAAIGFSIVLSELDNIFSIFFPKWELFTNLVQGIFNGDNIFLLAILLSVVAPLTEEFLFRGVILDRFLRSYSAWASFLLSAFFFGLIHLNPWQFIGSSILGVYMAWIVFKTNSIANSILVHAVFNGTPILILYGFKLEIPGFSIPFPSKIQVLQPLWLDLLGLLITCFGLSLTFFLFRRRKEKFG